MRERSLSWRLYVGERGIERMEPKLQVVCGGLNIDQPQSKMGE